MLLSSLISFARAARNSSRGVVSCLPLITHQNSCLSYAWLSHTKSPLESPDVASISSSASMTVNISNLLRDSSEEEERYHKSSDIELDHLYDEIEAFVEGLEGLDGDVEYSQGVLTIRLGSKGTFVINKQAPNRQIWVSSPISGPMRFDLNLATAAGGEKWIYKRDSRQLRQMLRQELKDLTGHDIKL